MNYKYTSVNRIFSKLIRDVKGDFSEGDVIEWCGEALEFIGGVKLYEEAVAFIEVKNHQCTLPAGTHAVIQVARNNNWGGPKDDSFCPANICRTDPTCDTESTTPVAIDCNGMPTNAYDIAYYRPFFDLKWEYSLWRGSSTYASKYSPVRLKNHTFFNSLICQEVIDGTENIYQSSVDEYTVVQGDTLRFSFECGSVAVAYLRQVLDEETGYPLVPDNISYTTAITKYITMKMFEKDFYAGREGAAQKMSKAEQDWHWYCKQAGNLDLMPNGIDEHQNMLDQRSYILPNNNRYYGYFGKLASPEGRKYNDPDMRNWHGFHYRGN